MHIGRTILAAIVKGELREASPQAGRQKEAVVIVGYGLELEWRGGTGFVISREPEFSLELLWSVREDP